MRIKSTNTLLFITYADIGKVDGDRRKEGMASLPYPLHGQNFIAEWVWQGCHTLLQLAAHM